MGIESTSASAAPAWSSLLEVIGLAADGVWETNSNHHFVRTCGEVLDGFEGLELTALPVVEKKSGDYLAALQACKSFRRVVVALPEQSGRAGYLSLNGRPIIDEAGECRGYRGTAADVSALFEQLELDGRLLAVVNASPDCIFLADAETQQFLFVNDTACQLTGYSRQELLQMCGYEMTGQTREWTDQLYKEAIRAGNEGISHPVHFATNKDGSRKGWWEPHHRAVKLDDRWAVITVSREASSRVLTERALERTKRVYAALSATNEGIMKAQTPHELYQSVCEAAVQTGGLAAAMILLPEDNGDLRPAAIAGAGKRQAAQVCYSVAPDKPEGQGLNGIAFRSGEACISNDFLDDPRMELWHGVGNQLGIRSAASIPLVRNGKAIGVLFLCSGDRRAFTDEAVKLLRDMAENLVFGLVNLEHEADRERAEERVRFLATHDSLTGLPNRVLFGELLDQTCASARRYDHKLAVLFIDLDRFKLVNDTLGHAAGDLLLTEMAKRLGGILRESDVLARLGGDEFVVLLPKIESAEDAATAAQRLLEAATPTITMMGQECRVTASIGISIYPDHGEVRSDLMKNADTAMYLAKDKGKNAFEFYVPGVQSQSTERLALEAGLRHAINNKELYLHYQAKLDLRSNAISGVEALLRWQHPTLGNIPPSRFIPLAEENGYIIPIGRWVLRTACRQSIEWQRQGLPPIAMAVNISPRQFADPDLLNDIKAALAESGLAPGLLELEITEGMVMHDPAHTIELLKQLRDLGVRIALDDFGVGYSSLAQIKGFPIDTLKVDRSFICNLPESSQDRAITEAIISMARNLSLRVVAEGVETEAQENFLRSLACDESQGFYFSKPASPEAFSMLLKSHGVLEES